MKVTHFNNSIQKGLTIFLIIAVTCIHVDDPGGQSVLYLVNKGEPSNPLEGLVGLAYKNNGAFVVHRCW